MGGVQAYCNVSCFNAHCNQVEPSCCHQWVQSQAQLLIILILFSAAELFSQSLYNAIRLVVGQ